MARLRPLADLAVASRRLVLLCYAQQYPEVHRPVHDALRDPAWAPSPEDSPVAWVGLEAWYQGLERTGPIVMDSY